MTSRRSKAMGSMLLGLTCLLGVAASAHATLVHASRAAFEATLGTTVVDDYENPAYAFSQSDAVMSGVLGETDYTSTGFVDLNLVVGGADHNYCAGCNGSFRLDFTATSVSDATGVYGAGFDIDAHDLTRGYFAFVVFGDASTGNFALPGAGSFWGLTSDLGIRSIHVGLSFGGFTNNGYIEIDNLTIGDAAGPGGNVPEPASLALALLGLAGASHRRRAG
ncbi:MAG: PEP-CTERM sorting domain-containing protein [Gammaproteobacteria bacterium]